MKQNESNTATAGYCVAHYYIRSVSNLTIEADLFLIKLWAAPIFIQLFNNLSLDDAVFFIRNSVCSVVTYEFKCNYWTLKPDKQAHNEITNVQCVRTNLWTPLNTRMHLVYSLIIIYFKLQLRVEFLFGYLSHGQFSYIFIFHGDQAYFFNYI